MSTAHFSFLPARLVLVVLAALAFSLGLNAQPQPFATNPTHLLTAHSHNDYEQKHPLDTALGLGFLSVEADVYLIDGDLYVSHERPKSLDPARTLDKLYLEPLAARLRANGGVIYPGHDEPLLLLIDVKGNADAIYAELLKRLRPYEQWIVAPKVSPSTQKTAVQRGGLIICLSGNRPLYQVLHDTAPLAVIDGRPDELKCGIPALLSPIVSAPFPRYFATWRGEGTPPPKELDAFRNFIRDAHAEGKRVRLWGAPDNETMWGFFKQAGVDLLNADDLPRVAAFLTPR